MRERKRWYRTDAFGRTSGPYVTYVLTQEEWDEKAKVLKVDAPHKESHYELGCGWDDTVYEMAMTECVGDERRLYLLEGHDAPMSRKITETMNEYNS